MMVGMGVLKGAGCNANGKLVMQETCGEHAQGQLERTRYAI